MPEQSALVTDITVAEITMPQLSKAGKMMPARIKDTQGRVWNVWKDKFEQLDVGIGRSYAAMYTSTPYSFVNPHTGSEQTGENRVIVGLNPLGKAANKVVREIQVFPPQADAKDEDIAINGLFHSPPLAQLAVQGDQATIVKAMKTMRLAYREYKKQSAILPSNDVEFDDAVDDIPY